MTAEYKLNPDGTYAPKRMAIGEVVSLSNKRFAFLCPCGIRVVIVTNAAHKASFDSEGRMTLKHSVGTKGWIHTIKEPFIRKGLPLEWCHFVVKNGIATVCNNAQCYGR